MPSYKFHYFDFRGRGELCRLLFAFGGQEYEDVRIPRGDWDAHKHKYIFNRVPVLEIDGKQYAQSMAIASYLARQFGIHGKTDKEILEIDQVLGIAGDIFAPMVVEFLEKDEKKKAVITKDNNEVKFPRFISFLETILKNNNTGFYVGDKLGFADIAAFECLDIKVDASIIQRFPLVKANMERVRAHKGIADWLAKRPVTDH